MYVVNGNGMASIDMETTIEFNWHIYNIDAVCQSMNTLSKDMPPCMWFVGHQIYLQFGESRVFFHLTIQSV